MTCPYLFLQKYEYKLQSEKLSETNTALVTEVSKLQKELEVARDRKGETTQLTSIQDELEKLRVALQEAHAQRKKLEEEHSTEKLGLEQVNLGLKLFLVMI